MLSASTLLSKTRRALFWLGAILFLASLCAGVVRSLSLYRSIPKVGVEYTSELRAAFESGGYERALPWMQSAVRIDLDNDHTANILVSAARQAGDVHTEVTALEKLVRLRPEDSKIRTELVSGLLSEGRAIEALAHGQVALRLDPESPLAYCNLGAALLGLDQKRDAALAYRKTLELDPNNESAQRALAFPLKDY